MQVLQYCVHQKLIEKSGVGRALYHQQRALATTDFTSTINKNNKFDLVHINTVFPSSYFFAKKMRKKGIPVVYHAHSTEEDFKNSYIGSNLVAPIFKRWLMKCYQSGDVIITPTQYSKSLLEGYGIKNPIYAVSNGIDTEEYMKLGTSKKEAFRKEYGYTKNDKIIMSVGLWLDRKGILDFVNLAKQMPEYQFIWFGESDLYTIPKKIREAVTTKLPNLKFAGYVKRDKLKEAYNACDLFLFPSKEETEGIVVLEALAMEIPVLVRDIPVYNGWLKKGQNVYMATNVDEFRDNAKAILEKKLPLLTEEGRKTAEDHKIESIGFQLSKAYIDAIRSVQNKAQAEARFKPYPVPIKRKAVILPRS